MRALFTFLVVLLSLTADNTLAQAPGDEDFLCNALPSTRHSYENCRKVLMDSFNYQNLLQGFSAVWRRRDLDDTGSGFAHGSGGLCQNGLRVCDYEHGVQDNWMFTQYINLLDANEVVIEVDFQLTDCGSRSRPDCDTHYVDLYIFYTNNPDVSAQTDPDNYSHESTLYQIGNDARTETPRLERPQGYTGLYLAIKDTGTCGTIKRIQVYYKVCPPYSVHLLDYPELPYPPQESDYAEVAYAKCVENAVNTSSLAVYSTGVGLCNYDVDFACQCLTGYEEDPPSSQSVSSPKSCIACKPGYYRSVNDIECVVCPEDHTVKSRHAATECPCEPGAFRAEGEGPDISCSIPPTAVVDIEVQVSANCNSTLCVVWEQPEVIGRDDFYYTVEISDPDALSSFFLEAEVISDEQHVEYCITGLRPDTEYIVKISVQNGVSRYDSDNDFLRFRKAIGTTCEGVPNPPDDIQPLCTVIVWKPPRQPNGNITNYELEFCSSSRPEDTDNIIKPPDANYHIIVESGDSYDQVRMRAYTKEGAGEWSGKIAIGCSPSPESETCPPLTCPEPETCPTPKPEPCPPTVTCPEPECPQCPTTEPVTCPTVTCPTVTCPPTPEPETCPPTVTCPAPEKCTTEPDVTTEPPTPPEECPDYQACTYDNCLTNNRKNACILRDDGCSGSCQVSHCRACFTTNVSVPANCARSCDFENENCLKKWGNCIRQTIPTNQWGASGSFICTPHPC